MRKHRSPPIRDEPKETNLEKQVMLNIELLHIYGGIFSQRRATKQLSL